MNPDEYCQSVEHTGSQNAVQLALQAAKVVVVMAHACE